MARTGTLRHRRHEFQAGGSMGSVLIRIAVSVQNWPHRMPQIAGLRLLWCDDSPHRRGAGSTAGHSQTQRTNTPNKLTWQVDAANKDPKEIQTNREQLTA